MSFVTALSQNTHTFPTVAEKDGLSEAVFSYLKTAKGVRKLVLELSATIADWITLYRPNSQLSALSANATHAKNWVSWAHVPEELVKIAEQARDTYQKKSLGSCGLLVNRVASLLVTATDIAGTMHHHRVYPLSKTALKNVGIVWSLAGLVNGVYDLSDSAQALNTGSVSILGKTHSLNDAQVQAAIGGVGAISDIAYAALTLLTYTTATVVAPWVLLALGTQSLMCTLGGHFYPHLRSPGSSAKVIRLV